MNNTVPACNVKGKSRIIAFFFFLSSGIVTLLYVWREIWDNKNLITVK